MNNVLLSLMLVVAFLLHGCAMDTAPIETEETCEITTEMEHPTVLYYTELCYDLCDRLYDSPHCADHFEMALCYQTCDAEAYPVAVERNCSQCNTYYAGLIDEACE